MISKETEEELLEFFFQAREIFKLGGMNIPKWGKNSPKEQTAAKQQGVWDDSEWIKVLGHHWNSRPSQDIMAYKTELRLYAKYTKRIEVRVGMQIYDLYSFISPEVRCRKLAQKLWTLKLKWDQSFLKHDHLMREWNEIDENIETLKSKFVRHLKVPDEDQLHFFSDASKDAYRAVAYFVVRQGKEYPKDKSEINFAKTRLVKNPKKESIPRSELMGMT